jgi:hypothetical protein
MRTIVKAPFEEVTDGFDYSGILAGDSLTSSLWEVEDGITGGSATFDENATQIEVSEGEVGNQYLVTNKVTTSSGRAYQRSFKVLVRAR